MKTKFDTYLDEAGQLWTIDRDKCQLIDPYQCGAKVRGILKHVWSTDIKGHYTNHAEGKHEGRSK